MPARQVSRFVYPRSLLRSANGSGTNRSAVSSARFQISPCQSRSADVQLSYHADWRWLPVAIPKCRPECSRSVVQSVGLRSFLRHATMHRKLSTMVVSVGPYPLIRCCGRFHVSHRSDNQPGQARRPRPSDTAEADRHWLLRHPCQHCRLDSVACVIPYVCRLSLSACLLPN